MKKYLLSTLLLTLMLRVWWTSSSTVSGSMKYKGGTGIVIGANVDSSIAFLTVIRDDGKIIGIPADAVTRSQWWEVSIFDEFEE